ncbi:Inositol polyphosphate-related phosphatase [Macleaya cordata]|uniref:Inositol polyphosphate-related phosphatase n=1 Tax=Macleaya cordata TaxID=56857 RepID=A0A200Q093_MACCD|nr:Inositol polyphosphate-related phosphatase [Macleaya cordata]
MSNALNIEFFRVFVATWNVGGKTPHSGLNLDNFLHGQDKSDIYVLGFQETVPLNAGNVLVIEDNQPAAKWLTLINKTLNGPQGVDNSNRSSTSSAYSTSYSDASGRKSLDSRDIKHTSGFPFFHRPSLKRVSKKFRTEKGRRLKTCNCPFELDKKYSNKDSCFTCQENYLFEESSSSDEDEGSQSFVMKAIASTSRRDQPKYSLIVSKQMVGIFVTIWVRKELVQHIGHLRVSCVGRGILGYLGNKGCISVSMSLHQTSFCFICSHLASGEKEGDEIRRNSDVIEILKNTQFPKVCKKLACRIPEKILDHDRIIWLGDLNYRIALSYAATRRLLEENAWHTLLQKDQLRIEREAGRVFKGWKEGKIYFAPTYKYSNNSDAYSGESVKSKEKRRTPAWCDRILWHGNGIEQLSYVRGESRFSDHRPVCAVFVVEVVVLEGRSNNALRNSNTTVEELISRTCSSRYLELNEM